VWGAIFIKFIPLFADIDQYDIPGEVGKSPLVDNQACKWEDG